MSAYCMLCTSIYVIPLIVNIYIYHYRSAYIIKCQQMVVNARHPIGFHMLGEVSIKTTRYSLIQIHSFQFIHSSTHSNSLIHSLMQINSTMHVHSLVHSFKFTHSFTHSNSLIHSFTIKFRFKFIASLIQMHSSIRNQISGALLARRGALPPGRPAGVQPAGR